MRRYMNIYVHLCNAHNKWRTNLLCRWCNAQGPKGPHQSQRPLATSGICTLLSECKVNQLNQAKFICTEHQLNNSLTALCRVISRNAQMHDLADNPCAIKKILKARSCFAEV